MKKFVNFFVRLSLVLGCPFLLFVIGCDKSSEPEDNVIPSQNDKIAIPDANMAVDLGLTVKWAPFNVGGTKPTDFGNYYAWGEIEPKKNE